MFLYGKYCKLKSKYCLRLVFSGDLIGWGFRAIGRLGFLSDRTGCGFFRAIGLAGFFSRDRTGWGFLIIGLAGIAPSRSLCLSIAVLP